MKKLKERIKFTKENIALFAIVILSAVLSFGNLGIEGYGNLYYAAAVKSMTMSLKNFFFVSFDPAGFVSIDKPPVGFWLQAISAKIFGYSGVSILIPSALCGVLSVILIYIIVKRSFSPAAGLLSALFLAVTPVFAAVSRNNTIDNILLFFLLLACLMLTKAAEKGKLRYLMLSMVFIGIGFNVKMLQAYLIIPAVYITYLLAAAVPLKKRFAHLAAGTFVLIAVSLSWAVIVDLIPASKRPYVDSSTNNTVMELILGHNGAERLSLGSSSGKMGGAPSGGNGKNQPPKMQGQMQDQNNSSNNRMQDGGPSGMPGGGMQGMPGSAPGGTQNGMPQKPGGNSSGQLQGTFGGQVSAGFTRLFSKNILSDQIVWFIPLAVLGFIAAVIKEKLKFLLDNRRKQSLALWFLWFLPEFIYFSFNTGTFHPYYLTMLAPPVSALAGIGLTYMYEFYKEGGWKSYILPVSLLINGAADILMLYYFIDYSVIVKALMAAVSILCIFSSAILFVLNSGKGSLKLKKIFVMLAVIGILITPFTGSAAVLSNKLNGSFPEAGLELLSGSQMQRQGQAPGMGSSNAQTQKTQKSQEAGSEESSIDADLIQFLEKNKTSSQKYLLVVQSSNSAAEIIIKTGEPVMSLGGYLGSDKILSLSQFKKLAKCGEVRYIMTGGAGGGGNSQGEIMNWVEKTGKLVSANQQLYDLKSYTDSFKTK